MSIEKGNIEKPARSIETEQYLEELGYINSRISRMVHAQQAYIEEEKDKKGKISSFKVIDKKDRSVIYFVDVEALERLAGNQI